MSAQMGPVALIQWSCVVSGMESGPVVSMGCPARTVRHSLGTP